MSDYGCPKIGITNFSVWIHGVTGFYRDLTEKTGYMLFLIPVSPYRIAIAKMLVAVCQLLLAAGLTGLMFAIDVKILFHKYETPMTILEWIASFLGVTMSEIWAAFFVTVLTSMLSTMALYAIAYQIMTVWAAVFGTRSSGKGIGVLLVILALAVFFTVIALSLPNLTSTAVNQVVRGFVRKIPRYLFYLVGTVGCTFGTGYLLNNKISL